MVVLQLLREFAGGTSIHGFGFLVSPKTSPRTKIIWAILLVIAMCYASMEMRNSVISKYHSPCLSPLDFWDIECHSNFFQFQNIKFKKLKINLISKLIFAGYTGSSNQVQTRKKIKLVLNSIFFQVWNKIRNPKFENRVQRDRALVFSISNFFRNENFQGRKLSAV